MYLVSRLLVIAFFAAFGATNAFAASGAGALISMTPLGGAPDGASAYRIVYTSTGLSGDLVLVTGVIIVPAGREPLGGRPIVAWAHPTTGIVSRCAPSLARVFFSSVQGLRAMLARGYIVTATDYPGLGTPEVHPYLVGISEGRAVAQFRSGGATGSRRWRGSRLCRLGTLSRGSRRPVCRAPRWPICTRIAARWSCRGVSAYGPGDAHDRRPRHGRGQQH